MRRRYTTMQDVIAHEIQPSLGDHADDFDVQAIGEATWEYRVDKDEQGNELLDTAGFELVVDTETYWAIVERNAK